MYELSVSRDPNGKGEDDFRVERTLQSVNGRPARKNQRAGLHRSEDRARRSRWVSARVESTSDTGSPSSTQAGGPPGTRAIDFIETPPERVQRHMGRQLLRSRRRRSSGARLVRSGYVRRAPGRRAAVEAIPRSAARRALLRFDPAIRVERSEMTLRFSRVNFQQPDETLLLPESIETLHVLRGVPSLRITPEARAISGVFSPKSEIQKPASEPSRCWLAACFTHVRNAPACTRKLTRRKRHLDAGRR